MKDNSEAFSRELDEKILLELIPVPEFDPNHITSDEEGTLLHRTSGQGIESVVEALLARPEIKVDVTNGNGYTALHLASFNGHLLCVKLMGTNNSAIDIKSEDEDEGYIPLISAVLNGHTEVVGQLMKSGADIGRPGFEHRGLLSHIIAD